MSAPRLNRSLLGWISSALVLLSVPPVHAAEAAVPAISGVWWTTQHEPHLQPLAGGALPFTAEGRARYEKNRAGLKNGTLVDQSVHLCLPQGLPRAMTSAYPIQIMVTPGQVAVVYEENRTFRLIPIAGQHASPDDWDPSFMGEGIAAWQGDTLTIDTTNFKADKIFLDETGLPVSEQLHVVEKLRLLDGGRRLEDVITITDPQFFTRPWSARRVYTRRDDIEVRTDWVCGESHRDVTSVRKGGKK